MGLLSQIAPFGNAIGGVAGSLIQNWGQRKLADQEFAQNKEMWNLNNQYNSPEMQMKRLSDAGLNPNLVYGNGSVVGNTTTQTPKYQAPSLQRIPLEMFNPLSVMGQYMDLKQKSANVDVTNETLKKVQIENQFLTDYLSGRNQNQYFTGRSKVIGNQLQSYLLGYPEYPEGEMGKNWKTSPFMQKFNTELQKNQLQLGKTQLEMQGIQNKNTLDKFQIDFMQTIPKQWQFIAPYLLRMIK